MDTNLKLIQKDETEVTELPVKLTPRERFKDNVKRAIENETLVSLTCGRNGMRAVVRPKPTRTIIARYDEKFGVTEGQHYDTSELFDDQVADFVEHKVKKGMQLQDACAIVGRPPASFKTKKQMLLSKAR